MLDLEISQKRFWIKLVSVIIFIIVVLAALFVHFSNPLYNWLTALILLGLSIFFLLIYQALFGSSFFFFLAFLSNLLPFRVARLGLFFIVPLALYAFIPWVFPSMKKQARWFYLGTIDKFTWLGGFGVAIVSSAALYLWVVLTKPDLSDLYSFVPGNSKGALILVGIGFALLNAFVEESIYRGILWEAFGKIFNSVVVITLLQASIFALAHIHGFPRGASGVGLAFIYGLMLGVIRHRSKGLLAPIIVHFVADFAIYLILLGLMGRIQIPLGSEIMVFLALR
jgi:uncharacterized protein